MFAETTPRKSSSWKPSHTFAEVMGKTETSHVEKKGLAETESA